MISTGTLQKCDVIKELSRRDASEVDEEGERAMIGAENLKGSIQWTIKTAFTIK